MAKKAVTASKLKAVARTGVWRRVTGSNTLPIPNPIWMSSNVPATEKAANAAKIPNARTAPTAASVKVAKRTCAIPVGTAIGVTFSAETVKSVKLKTRRTRTGAGTDVPLNIGVKASSTPSLTDSRNTEKAHRGSISNATGRQKCDGMLAIRFVANSRSLRSIHEPNITMATIAMTIFGTNVSEIS